MEFSTTAVAAELAETYRRYPIDDHGKLRFAYASYTADGALADGDTIALAILPTGRKRIIPALSRVSTSAYGASRTLDIGHQAYMKRPPNETQEAEDPDAFVATMDVSSAVSGAAFSTDLKFDMYSTEEIVLFATVNGGTLPDGGTLEVLVAYLYE